MHHNADVLNQSTIALKENIESQGRQLDWRRSMLRDVDARRLQETQRQCRSSEAECAALHQDLTAIRAESAHEEARAKEMSDSIELEEGRVTAVMGEEEAELQLAKAEREVRDV